MGLGGTRPDSAGGLPVPGGGDAPGVPPAALGIRPRPGRCRAHAPAGARGGASAHGAGSSGGSVAPGSAMPSTPTTPRTPVASAPSSSTAKKPAKSRLHGNPARALLAFEAMQKHYYIKGSGLYVGEPFSYLFPFSQALAATVSMANIPNLPAARCVKEQHARLSGLNAYLDMDNSGAPEGTYTSTLAAFDGAVAPPAGPGGPKYYDDNDWVGIELARLYEPDAQRGGAGHGGGDHGVRDGRLAGEPGAGVPGRHPVLEHCGKQPSATRSRRRRRRSWRCSCTGSRITASTCSSRRWPTNGCARCLLQPSGLYADHIGRHGDGGTDAVELQPGLDDRRGRAAVPGDAQRGATCTRPARRRRRRSRTSRRNGWASEIPFFPSVYFRNLLYLDSVTHDPPGPTIAQAYVNYAWQHLRLQDDLFVAGSPPAAQLLVQAAIVQIYALLSSPASTYF